MLFKHIEDFEKPQSLLSNRFENSRRTSKLKSYSKLSIRNFLVFGAAASLVGCASPSLSTQYSKRERIGGFVVLAAGVTDLGILTGPPSRWGAVYSVVDNISHARHRVFLFDEGYDGALDVVCASYVSENNKETAVCYWKDDKGLRQYENLFRALDSQYGVMLREKYP